MYPKIKEFYKSTDNSIDIKMTNGREIRITLDGKYNPNTIRVLYHSHEWDWTECKFNNFGYPED